MGLTRNLGKVIMVICFSFIVVNLGSWLIVVTPTLASYMTPHVYPRLLL